MECVAGQDQDEDSIAGHERAYAQPQGVHEEDCVGVLVDQTQGSAMNKRREYKVK